jgi:addiction module RelE/StbE family toxin
MNIKWTSQAEDDLQSILVYIILNNPTAAVALVDAIVDSVEHTLSSHPNAGRKGRVEGTREWVAHKKYVVAYRVKNDCVQVVSVMHSSRLWPDVF